MPEQSIACPSCGKKIPLTRALRAEIEQSVERELRAKYEQRLEADVQRAEKDAASKAEKKLAQELVALRDQINEQAKDLDEARRNELAMRRRERELERKQQDLELEMERKLGQERARLVADTQERFAEEHRLKDAEKERQLADMRRQIEDLKRKAEQGSQQLQGEVGEEELESLLRSSFPSDDIQPIGQGVRGADLHQIVVDSRSRKCGSILWECKNTKHWNDGWLAKLKQDQRALHADVAVLVSAVMPKGCTRFALIDDVLVTDFACAPCLAGVLRANLSELARTRTAAMHKEEKLELLHRYLSGVEFRQRVEAVVEAFTAMRHDLDQERRAAERQWARRARQIDAVTLNVSGMYGDLQGILPALPSIRQLELPAGDLEASA
ncbi:MAG TPA: DUF2130 domain-containing protein [Vicinamibacterales bacterium]|jgi:hypothetical protein|nr:DUF2130 domain-containing protein [Vicinamibacterales bacterium]